MAYDITIIGKDTDSAWGSGFETVTVKAYEVKPSFEIAQESIVGASGSYFSKRMFHLKFSIVPIPYSVVPSSTAPDNRDYFTLMRVLNKKFQRITAIGDSFARIKQGTTGLIAASWIQALPIPVRVLSISELESDYARGENTVTFDLISSTKYFN